MILDDTGFILDVVVEQKETSTDGKQGRRFFSEELIPTLKRICKKKYHDDLLQMHALMSTILHVV